MQIAGGDNKVQEPEQHSDDAGGFEDLGQEGGVSREKPERQSGQAGG